MSEADENVCGGSFTAGNACGECRECVKESMELFKSNWSAYNERRRVQALPCPLCDSDQIQVMMDFNNPDKDAARCRKCKCTAPMSTWNNRKPEEPKIDSSIVRAAAIEESATLVENYWSLWSNLRPSSSKAFADFLARNIRQLAVKRTVVDMPTDEMGPGFSDGPDEEGFKGPRPWNGFNT